jgi:hypothetical protein
LESAEIGAASGEVGRGCKRFYIPPIAIKLRWMGHPGGWGGPLLGLFAALGLGGYWGATTTIMKVPGLGLGRAPAAAGSISAVGR